MFTDELLLTTKEAAALARPSDRDYLSVVNWFESNKPLVTDEADYIKRKEDIIMLRAESNLSGLEGVVERGLASLDSFLQEHFDSNIVPVSPVMLSFGMRLKRADTHTSICFRRQKFARNRQTNTSATTRQSEWTCSST